MSELLNLQSENSELRKENARLRRENALLLERIKALKGYRPIAVIRDEQKRRRAFLLQIHETHPGWSREELATAAGYASSSNVGFNLERAINERKQERIKHGKKEVGKATAGDEGAARTGAA